jgi:hypothetical protein
MAMDYQVGLLRLDNSVELPAPQPSKGTNILTLACFQTRSIVHEQYSMVGFILEIIKQSRCPACTLSKLPLDIGNGSRLPAGGFV